MHQGTIGRGRGASLGTWHIVCSLTRSCPTHPFSCNAQQEEIGANKKERVSALDGLIDGYMGRVGGGGSLTGPSTAFSH